MKKTLVLPMIGFSVLLAGCSLFPFAKKSKDVEGQYTGFEKPTAEHLVAYLNKNEMKLDSLKVDDLELQAKRGLLSFHLSGKLACQKPRNFRMEAYGPGRSSLEADLGSNDREFWFYLQRNDPPYLFHCAHQEVNRLPTSFPFHPDWILEALGMTHIPSTENFRVEMPPRSDTIELVEASRSPQGQPVNKVTVFNKKNAVGTEPQVIARKIMDMRGNPIATARITEMQYDQASGAILPRKVEIEYHDPKQNFKLGMTLDTVTVNGTMDPQYSQVKFSRPNYPGVQAFDLARAGKPDMSVPNDVRQAGTFRGLRRN